MIRLEGIEHANGDAALHGRQDGLGMQHLGAVERQLGRFDVGDLRDGARVGDDARIGGQDAADVGPDLHFVGVERRAQNGGRVVGTAAPQRGADAGFRRADEAGHHRHDAAAEQRHQSGLGMARRRFLQRVRRPEVVVGHDQLSRVHPLGGDAVGAQHGGQQRRSQPFAQSRRSRPGRAASARPAHRRCDRAARSC